MADKTKPEEEEDDDYLGDISKFLPTDHTSSHPSKKLTPSPLPNPNQPSTKKPKTQQWQDRRRADLARKQREEDEKTLTNISSSAIPQSNIGFKMLTQMGYNPGSALGKDGSGRVEPVGVEIRRSRAGIGREDPVKEKMRKEESREVMERRKVEEMVVEFGVRQKSQWRSRRVKVNFYKAKAVVDQLENREVVELEKEDVEEQEDDDEEEEVITQEDLHDILTKLRHEHFYCLFCGFQYESMEALSSNCPGIDEDDH